MQVRLDEEQLLLRDTAREFLARECPVDVVRARMDDPQSAADALWKAMSELGWAGLHVPEVHGGAGLDLLSMALLLEELGRVLAPSPLLVTALVVPGLVGRFGTPAQQAEWLPRIAAGEDRVAFAHLEHENAWSARGVALEARRDGDGLVLSGTKRFIQDGLVADTLLVTARLVDDGGALALIRVPAEAPGVERRAIDLYEKTRSWAEARFDDVRVGGDAAIGAPDEGDAALAWALDLARVGLSAEMTGGARRVLEMSVEYAKHREQFGQPIGQFQAIAHKCADMLVAAESMNSATWYAAWSVGCDEPDARTSACLAKSFCSDAWAKLAGDGIQIHGGLGFTWEQDLHLYFKHAKAAAFLYGDGHALREIAARDMIDGAG